MEETPPAHDPASQLWTMLVAAVLSEGGTESDLEILLADKKIHSEVARLTLAHSQSSRSKKAEAKAAEVRVREAEIEEGQKAIRRANAAETMKRLQAEEAKHWAAVESATYKVEIDYAQSFDRMIKAGRYDSIRLLPHLLSPYFLPKISGWGKVKRELVLVFPDGLSMHALCYIWKVYGFGLGITDCSMSTDEVLAELNRRGLQPARVEDLLAFGAKFPRMQRKFPIVALGSLWDRDFAYLDHYGRERTLHSSSGCHGWYKDHGFLAVRKDAK